MPRSIPHAPWRLASSATVMLHAAALGQCPPEGFDYGPSLDLMVAAVVIDHAGPAGPILPNREEYGRAASDIALIRHALPALAQVGHSTPWVPAHILIEAAEPFSAELLCANEYYGAVATRLGGSDLYGVRFPVGHVNTEALARTYRELPGVFLAGPTLWGCADWCCSATWSYEPVPAGDWRWVIRIIQALIGGCQFAPHEQSAIVGADGVVRPVCYANCDQSQTPPILNVLDFNCFLNRFGAGDLYANCDGSTEAPILNILDFTCFVSSFTDGCP